MSTVLLTACRVVDPRSPFNGQVCDIALEQGRITSIQAAHSIPTEGFAAHFTGLHVSPGWVDIGPVLQDPGHEYKETLPQLLQAASKGGFTHVVCQLQTSPAADQATVIRSLLREAKGQTAVLLPMGLITQNGKGKELAEMYDMQQAGAVAFCDGAHALQHSGVVVRALQHTSAFGGLILTHLDDETLTAGSQMNEGVQSTLLGLRGAPELAEEMAANKLSALHQYAGGRLAIGPVSAPQAAEILYQAGIPQGTTIAHVCFDDSILAHFDENFKIFPPLRAAASKEKLCKQLTNGTFQWLSSGHQAQGTEEKRLEFPQAEFGMLGLQTFFPLAMEHLVAPGHLSLNAFIELVSIGPRHLLNLPPALIAENEEVSLTLFDPETEWTLNSTDIPSAAKNSPFIGKQLKGKVATILL